MGSSSSIVFSSISKLFSMNRHAKSYAVERFAIFPPFLLQECSASRHWSRSSRHLGIPVGGRTFTVPPTYNCYLILISPVLHAMYRVSGIWSYPWLVPNTSTTCSTCYVHLLSHSYLPSLHRGRTFDWYKTLRTCTSSPKPTRYLVTNSNLTSAMCHATIRCTE